ncbi:uncharacterized protein LOC130961302 isoform X1 [Arachis stenosperma]|uniref:uncharacterized protein LOC130961302 isoform X1 n=1 Tax=Arachis stenosperma TaxID=217475 RepID=UPI0025AD272E|nr:uncharacterized protein LOC130961302 isoform X1 [Arachis stenosperma]
MMESKSPLLHDNSENKNAFRKPSGDAANRNYRRRSPVDGSASPDGSPQLKHNSSPNPVREDSARASHHHSRKYDSKEHEQQHYGRSKDSFRNSDRQSSRSSYGHSRPDKHADEHRYHGRLHSRYESKGDHSREEAGSKTKDYQRTLDKYSRDKYDRSHYRNKEKDRETYLEEHQKYRDKDSSYDRYGFGRKHALHDDAERERGTRERDDRDDRRGSHRSYGDYKSDRVVSYSESRSQRDESGSQRESGKYRLKEACRSEEELDGQDLPLEEKRKYDDSEIGKDKDQNTRKVDDRFGNVDKESFGKKPKLFGVDKDDSYGNDDEKQTSSPKLSHESKVDSRAPKTSGFDVCNDIDAAKVAAMKAAELVNKNLVGVGCLTTDQKKKLLWGGKKSSTTEESGHRWDTALFSDRERQEKFNKLMSLRLYSCLWPIVGCERRSQSGAEIRQSKWQQRVTPGREAEGTPAGPGETVHCRPSTKRWTHCWIRSLDGHSEEFAYFDICNVFEYHSTVRRLSLVCFRYVWETLYALMVVEPQGSWWKLLVRHAICMKLLMIVFINSDTGLRYYALRFFFFGWIYRIT